MVQTLINVFKVAELRNKVLFCIQAHAKQASLPADERDQFGTGHRVRRSGMEGAAKRA